MAHAGWPRVGASRSSGSHPHGPAGFELHPLKGQMKGFWAVTVRANWRVIFRFAEGHAEDVDYLDYH